MNYFDHENVTSTRTSTEMIEKPLRVLFIEDSATDAEIILYHLKKAYYRVISNRVETAADMKMALENNTWDLIIADYHMPQFNAPDALAVLHASELDIPFIVISGTISEEAALSLMQAGVRDYLMKDRLGRLIPVIERELSEAKIRRERKRMEEELEESRSIFHLLIESLPQNVFAKDLEGRFILANQRYCLTESKTLDEIIGKTDMELHPVELAEKYIRDDRWVIETGQMIEIEEVHQPLGQEKTYVQVIKAPLYDAKNQIAGTLGIFWDITERKRMEDTLVAERNLLRTLIDNLPDRIYVKDLLGRKTLANIADIRVSGGRSVEDVLGKQDSAMYPPELAARYAADDKSVLETGVSIINSEEPGLDADGNPAWVLSTKVALQDSQGKITGMVGIGRDITERKQHELEQLVIASVSSALRSAATRAEMLPIILDQVLVLVGTAQAALVLYEEETGSFVLESARGDWAKSQGGRIPMRESVNELIIAQGHPKLYEDIHQEPVLSKLITSKRPQMIAAIPLIANQQAIGVLWVGRYKDVPTSHPFTDDEIRALIAIADIAANGINRTNLYEESQRVAKNLIRAYDRTLEGWARVQELRDQETEDHTRRVTQTTVELAQAFGFDSGELEHIRRGALLHDIGKMGIPDSVLLKPGALTESEWEIMRRHPQYAYELLKPIEYLQTAIDIPYCHHERWTRIRAVREHSGCACAGQDRVRRIHGQREVRDSPTEPQRARLACSSHHAAESYTPQQSCAAIE